MWQFVPNCKLCLFFPGCVLNVFVIPLYALVWPSTYLASLMRGRVQPQCKCRFSAAVSAAYYHFVCVKTQRLVTLPDGTFS